MRMAMVCLLICIGTGATFAQAQSPSESAAPAKSAASEAGIAALRAVQAALSQLQQPFLSAQAAPGNWRRNFDAANLIIRRALMQLEASQPAGEDLLTVYELAKDFELAGMMLNPGGGQSDSQKQQPATLHSATDKLAEANQQLFAATKSAIHDLTLSAATCAAHQP